MKNKIRKTMVVIMTAALFVVTLGVAFSVDVSADGTYNLNAVGNQDVKLKTDGADASYFVVAIPQEIIMTKESESLIDYSGSYAVQAKGIIQAGKKLIVRPAESTANTPSTGKYQKQVTLTDEEITTKTITATMTQDMGFFYPTGESVENGVEISPSEFVSISGNSIATVEVPGTYSGTVGFTVALDPAD